MSINLENKTEITYAKYIVWGAGNTSRLYASSLQYESIDPLCYIDTHKAGSIFNGKPVYSPEYLQEQDNPLVLVSSAEPSTLSEIKKRLSSMSINYYSLDEYILAKNMDNIQKVYTFLKESSTHDSYMEIINCRMEGRFPKREHISPVLFRYFSPPVFQQPDPSDIVLDLGAYCGDSFEKFVFVHDGMFQKYYLFEPVPEMLNACRKRTERLQQEWALDTSSIVMMEAAVGNSSGQAVFVAGDSKVGGRLAGAEKPDASEISLVRQLSLDELFSGNNERVSFIKADIEGAEYEMLLGARKLICRDRPRLALSLYHNPSDMYRIPLLLKSMIPDYRFEFYHYSCKWGDSILYAW